MNEHEARRIAAAANMLRPEWPLASILTILSRPELASRPRRDVAVALVWVACESSTKTPARVLESGPWWKATSLDTPPPRQRFDPRLVCTVCAQSEAVCREAGDHRFVSIEQARSVPSQPVPGSVREAIAARKAELCSHGVARDHCVDHAVPRPQPTPQETP